MNGLNAAAALALQAALGNPGALQPLLMASQNPWLASQLMNMGMGHNGQLNNLGNIPTTGAGPAPPVDASSLAAAAQFGQQMGAAGSGKGEQKGGWG